MTLDSKKHLEDTRLLTSNFSQSIP